MTTATATTPDAIISISTSPPIGHRRSSTFDRRRISPVGPVAGSVARIFARIVAGLTGALLGVAIGLVSAGFDTTRLLLAVGAVALGLGWLIALATSDGPTALDRR